jgi:hypothetical protein
MLTEKEPQMSHKRLLMKRKIILSLCIDHKCPLFVLLSTVYSRVCSTELTLFPSLNQNYMYSMKIFGDGTSSVRVYVCLV